MGYFDRIKESDNSFVGSFVGAAREYWDSVLSFAAGYLFSEMSAAMVVGGVIVEYMGRKDGRTLAKEYTSPFEAYLSENISRFVRNGLCFSSGMFLTGTLDDLPEIRYIVTGLLSLGAAYAFHRSHHSPRHGLPEVESAEDNSS